MAKYTVKGEEGAEVAIPGTETPAKVGDVVELEAEVAAPLVEEGKLEAVVDNGGGQA